MKGIKSGQSFNGEMDDEEMEIRRQRAEECYKDFLYALGYDLHEDPNMEDTPRRVVKMLMRETCKGTYLKEPRVTTFPSDYTGIVFEGDIDVKSLCSHHMMPFFGKAYIAYIPQGEVIGLSKLNRIVDWFSRRPQLQEQLTQQIHDYLQKVLPNNQGIAIFIEANHTCVSLRGIEHHSVMKTSKLSGAFLDNTDKSREEFFQMIKRG